MPKKSWRLYEITCGLLVLLGLFTRLAVIPLLTIMAVALFSTKLPILVDSGFWKMAHDSRTDFSMTLGAVFLLVVGAGAWSIDRRLSVMAARQIPQSPGENHTTSNPR